MGSFVQPESLTYRARWVVPVSQPTIENGFVRVVDGLIAEVGKQTSISESVQTKSGIRDLGDVALVPGLINSHAHLEFSDLRKPLGNPGIPFTDWIRLVVGSRTARSTPKSEAIRIGLRESFDSGTWVVGEIATSPLNIDDYEPLASSHLIQIFLEQLGRDEATFADKRKTLDAILRNPIGHTSPHAPYSTHPDLVKQICDQASAVGRTVAMHLAETEAEIELLENQSGPFVKLLQELGVWDPTTFNPRTTIFEFLTKLSAAPRALVIHGNYLTSKELDLIASNRGRMSVVYCPRTHDFFRHASYPLDRINERNIRVVVGTDSRASNPDLALWQELVVIAQKHPSVEWNAVLKMATLDAALALGIESQYGSIEVGKKAALSLVKNTGSSTNPIESWIFDANSRCVPVVLDHDG